VVGDVTTERIALGSAVGALVIAGALPLGAMLVASVWTADGFGLGAYASLFGSARPRILFLRSLAVGGIATACALAIGAPVGTLCERTDLPGRGLLAVVLAVPFVLPTYVHAVGWARLFSSSVPLQGSLLATGLVLGSCLAPLVLLATRASLRTVDPRLEEAARLSAGWIGTLRGVTLPLALPGVARAAGLVFLLAVGDLAVPTYLAVDVFPTASFTQFAAAYRFGSATALAMPLVLLALVVLSVESRILPDRVASLRGAASERGRARIELCRARWPLSLLLGAACAGLVALPLGALVRDALTPGALAEAWDRAHDAALRSLAWAAIGACLLTLVGSLLGYLVERRVFRFARALDRLALLLFATPSTVLGIGLVALWNHPATSWIYATPAVVLLGYVGQLAAVPSRLCASAVAAVPRRLEEAAQLAGARWHRRVLFVVAPLAAPGLAAAWLASFLFCLRDLGISMIVYPPGADTLPVRSFTLMANGPPPLVAALCVLMIAAALGPLLVLAASLRRMTVR
jgi:iron(III) transport system permease protein